MNKQGLAVDEEGPAVALLSSELEIEQRINIIGRFREGKEKVLITTHSFARRLDLQHVWIMLFILLYFLFMLIILVYYPCLLGRSPIW